MRKLFCLAFVAATLMSAKKAPSKEDFDRLERKVDEIGKILKEADAPPPPIKVDVQGAQALGVADAPVTVVEFTDMQCPYCRKFHAETFPALHDKYIATGKVRFISLDLPLPMHKQAHLAALAGRCAGEQGHYWEMRDWMQSNPDGLEVGPLRSQAHDIDLDMDQFDNCLVTDKYKEDIERDAKEAQALGINGTPAFIIGKSGPMVEGQLITGAMPLEAFERAILAVK